MAYAAVDVRVIDTATNTQELAAGALKNPTNHSTLR